MTLETHNTKTTKPRRWFRFGLRTLLVLVTVVSVTLGWVVWEIDQRRQEKVTIDWIVEMDGTVEFPASSASASFDSGYGEKSIWEKTKGWWFGETVRDVLIGNNPVSDLSPLAKLKDLERLTVISTQVNELSPLAELKGLNVLALNHCPVSDLSPLVKLKNIKILYLENNQVRDLLPLSDLDNLGLLSLRHTQVIDLSPLAELKKLRDLELGSEVCDLSTLSVVKNLVSLRLGHNQVRDLSSLAELTKLRFLDLRNAKVSEEQLQELKLALPNCKIEF